MGGRGGISSYSFQQALFWTISPPHSVVAVTLLYTAECAVREAQPVHDINASSVIIQYGTNQEQWSWCTVSPPICLLRRQQAASWAEESVPHGCAGFHVVSTSIYANHKSVGLFVFLKLSMCLRPDSPSLSIWGSGRCSGLHSFWAPWRVHCSGDRWCSAVPIRPIPGANSPALQCRHVPGVLARDIRWPDSVQPAALCEFTFLQSTVFLFPGITAS